MSIIRTAMPPEVCTIHYSIDASNQPINIMGALSVSGHMPGLSTLTINFDKRISIYDLKKHSETPESLTEMAYANLPDCIKRYIVKHETHYADSSVHIIINYTAVIRGNADEFMHQLEKESWNNYSNTFDEQLEKTLTDQVE
jgi:hypothetical protein